LFRRRCVTGDVMLRRRFVTETFCRGDISCGDVLYVRQYTVSRAKEFILANQNISISTFEMGHFLKMIVMPIYLIEFGIFVLVF
jgi:hypothetical protein